MGRVTRLGLSVAGEGLSAVVSRRRRGASGDAAGSAHALPSVPVAASRRGGAYGDSGCGGGGGNGSARIAGATVACSGTESLGRGGATTDASEKAASVIPISRWRARLMRGNSTPKQRAARITTAGKPTMINSSLGPKARGVAEGETRATGCAVGMYTHNYRDSITNRALAGSCAVQWLAGG